MFAKGHVCQPEYNLCMTLTTRDFWPENCQLRKRIVSHLKACSEYKTDFVSCTFRTECDVCRPEPSEHRGSHRGLLNVNDKYVFISPINSHQVGTSHAEWARIGSGFLRRISMHLFKSEAWMLMCLLSCLPPILDRFKLLPPKRAHVIFILDLKILKVLVKSKTSAIPPSHSHLTAHKIAAVHLILFHVLIFFFFSPQLRCHSNSVFGRGLLNKDAHGLEEIKHHSNQMTQKRRKKSTL